ncbi:hypothetical protein D3C78_1431730 [compost metagenome]
MTAWNEVAQRLGFGDGEHRLMLFRGVGNAKPVEKLEQFRCRLLGIFRHILPPASVDSVFLVS